MTCKPILTAKEAAEFIGNCYTREYRIKCLAHMRAMHGDQYADQVKSMVEQMFKGRKK